MAEETPRAKLLALLAQKGYTPTKLPTDYPPLKREEPEAAPPPPPKKKLPDATGDAGWVAADEAGDFHRGGGAAALAVAGWYDRGALEPRGRRFVVRGDAAGCRVRGDGSRRRRGAPRGYSAETSRG